MCWIVFVWNIQERFQSLNNLICLIVRKYCRHSGIPPTDPTPGAAAPPSTGWWHFMAQASVAGKTFCQRDASRGPTPPPIWESLRQIAKQIEVPACLLWPENAHKHTYTHKRTHAHLHTRLRHSDQRPIPDSGACRQSLSYHPPELPAQSQYSFSGPSLNWSLRCRVLTVSLSSMTNRTWQPY